jgi:glutaredoxin
VTTYPQVFVNAEHVGGAEEVEAWLIERRQIAA